MKIALIGDLQYKPGEEAEVFSYMRHVAAWQPDIAVSLGDMGSGRQAGTKEAMAQCREFFSVLPCRTIALLGNHDVEYRPDDETRLRTPETWRREVFGSETPYAAFEAEGFFVLCLSVERQPEEMLLSQHALYTSPEQMRWAKEQLRAHRDRPTIVLSHAPCAGSGLRCCPPVHHAATDAFMGQDFDPHAWKELLQENPQIFLWASAHFHMGHGYERAITHRAGTTHVSCGVMSSCARDNTRQTRLMELHADGSVTLSTIDHLAGGAITQDLRLRAGEPPEETPPGLLIGGDHALRAWDAPQLGRAYIATQAGRLWEYDRALDELTGTLCLGTVATEVSADGSRLYVRTVSDLFSVPLAPDTRFLRLSGFVPQERRAEETLCGTALSPLSFSAEQRDEGEYIVFR